MPHIVINVFGSLGDVHPYLAVADVLKERGHRLTFAANEFYREEIELRGHGFAPVRPDLSGYGNDELRNIIESGLDPKNGSRFIMESLLLPSLAETHEDLMSAVAGADLLISGVTSIAAPTVALVSGIPWISTLLSPLFFLSPSEPISFLTRDRLITLPAIAPLNSLLLAIARSASSSWTDELNRFRRSLGLPAHRDPLIAGARSQDLTLGLYSPLFAPLPNDRQRNTLLTGFPRHDQYASYNLPLALESFLTSGEEPIVFTLGSSAVHIAGDFFIQSSLAARALDRRAVLLVGDNPDPRLTDFLDERIVAHPYIPHSLLFPRARAIVHHGGIGTTAAALIAGVPSLIVPFGQDQPDNARRARDLGVARVLPRKGYNANTASGELCIILEESAYRDKARSLEERLRAENGAVTAADLIENFLADGKALSPSRPFTRVTFPDGSEIATYNPDEARSVHPQIDGYFRHGIEVMHGDVVFDVGANIGLFCDRVDRLCHGSVKLHAFEPIPETFQLLRENSRRFRSRDIHLYLVAIGRGSERVTLAYYPKATALSTAYPEGLQKDKLVYRQIAMESKTPLDFLPRFLKSALVGVMIERATRGRSVTCRGEPLSVYLDDIDRVDLLKIDVERAELDVLAGIGGDNWAKIRQIVLEIHDIDGRAKVIEELLARKGFEVVLDREPVYERLNIYNAYAKRPRNT
jgi:rhamnosyltransferase subunit B